ncbi:uncharacterized protein LOC132628828 [Lycium barbarum]|uniref:uncharacterized protein LOC132628828 n=1 Tax=Lycium barbarum TaxID=112863 RepID=UPI00293EFAC9|nr:uncharacterized protein LOC132628828 [Lycium barbarum]
MSLDEEEKRRFWEDLDEVVGGLLSTEKLFIGGDFNGHIGSVSRGHDDVHGGFGFGDRNGERVSLLDFAKAFGLVVANSRFPKKEKHLVTFHSSLAVTQIDYLLLRKDDKGLCKDCKMANYIREAAREVIRVSRGRRGGHRGDWWWNGEVQGKVEAKKQVYAKLADSKDDGEKQKN